LEKYHLVIAPGYKTSIEIYTNKLLLCSEIAHRMMNKESVYDYINNIFRRNERTGKEMCINELVGQTVLTGLVVNLITYNV
jgi:hypothetical protein